MTPTEKRAARNARPRDARRQHRPIVETCEDRLLMTASNGFINGTVQLATNGAGQSGATIELYTATSVNPIATTQTDSNGNYVFNNLRPGNYVVKEVAPAGYTNDGVNPVSQLNPATPAGIDTIDVTVVNPSSVYLTSGGAVAASSASIRDTVDFLFGNTVTAGAYTATLGSTSGGSDLSPSFPTFLADALPSLSAGGGQSVQVTPTPLSQLNVNGLPISASAAGRIAFLLNTYGGTTLSNVQGAALQLAIWELTYDDGGTPNFSNGFFQANGPAGATTSAQFSAIIAQATTYYNASAGQDQTGAVLVAGQPSLFNLGRGLDDVFIPSSLNFINKSAPNIVPSDNVNCPISNLQYIVNGVNVGSSLDGNVVAGDTVQVDFTIPPGEQGRFSLASYSADANFDLSSEWVDDYQTRLLGPGNQSLQIVVPSGSNQEIYFIHGSPLSNFNINNSVDYFDTNQYIDSATAYVPLVPVAPQAPSTTSTSPNSGSSTVS